MVRTAASTSALMLGTAVWRATDASLTSRAFGASLCLGAAIYTASSSSPPPGPLLFVVPAALLSGGLPFFFWGWTRSIMDDDFRLSPGALLAGLVLMGVTVVIATAPSPSWRSWAIAAHSLLGLAFVAAAFVDVLRGWRADLVEPRRLLRLVVLVASGGDCMIVLTVELLLRNRAPIAELQLLNALLLAILLLGLPLTVVNLSPLAHTAFGWSPPLKPAPATPAEVAANDPERQLMAKLEHLMTAGAAYRSPEIAVGALATRLGVSEKRLRELINQCLGHKNFASFVNAYRLEEVCQRLRDTRHDHLPILTLALDAGFGSIVAFNRAFKQEYRMTPSEYRGKRDDELRDAGA